MGKKIVHGPGIEIEWTDAEAERLRKVLARPRTGNRRIIERESAMRRLIDSCEGLSAAEVGSLINERHL